jgi:hypothetical protein
LPHANCTDRGLLQSCFMQLARTADCCNLASCKLHGPRIAAILPHANCTDRGLLQSCFMQTARTADCCNLASCRLHGLRIAAILLHANCTDCGLLHSCFMQTARTADCCNLASCRLHEQRIAAILLDTSHVLGRIATILLNAPRAWAKKRRHPLFQFDTETKNMLTNGWRARVRMKNFYSLLRDIVAQ